ncbi:MAG TPA: flagellar basal body rod protein FlgC [Desulfotomaculum sp.]|nr:MAG: Flagellar basal-body rod protein FlgC [Desulfotomaculum sp. 46_80]HAG11543.1 flagellar basal body rod protein FlgC [Desulfotomaculum sp.]HBY03753.1 flagellar basal body rod protein FlgC [Desulfotomaculum sp.]
MSLNFMSFKISESGLAAEKMRLNLIAANLANINTSRTSAGGPYKRKAPVFEEKFQLKKDNNGNYKIEDAGVKVSSVWEDQSPPRLAYEPNNPEADQQGIVAYPNINAANEMIDLITASRAYEANLMTLEAAKTMDQKALELSK